MCVVDKSLGLIRVYALLVDELPQIRGESSIDVFRFIAKYEVVDFVVQLQAHKQVNLVVEDLLQYVGGAVVGEVEVAGRLVQDREPDKPALLLFLDHLDGIFILLVAVYVGCILVIVHIILLDHFTFPIQPEQFDILSDIHFVHARSVF